jgi:hypothetical protein
MRLLDALVLAFMSTALITCTSVTHETPSGRAEVTIPNTTVDRVKSYLVSIMTNKGYRITKDSQFQISFDKPSENIALNVLLGSKYDSTPNMRVSYDIAALPNGIRVISDLAVITNPGSAFERRTEVNEGPASAEVQAILTLLEPELNSQSSLRAARGKGIVLGLTAYPVNDAIAKEKGLPSPRGILVALVSPNGPADRAGVKKGDIVVTYQGQPVSSPNDIGLALGASKKGETVRLQLWRDGAEVGVDVKL